ncbi:MAG: PTS-dependent dihydroxyacetone kinase phosphotransferase subunit DhaM [Lachnospiraceae bacterium]|nr:PTS-dependent dihydroxyacetone kinase phosphotransferase subunit DhaM [Lachnospiraceae bacterium]
MVGLVIVSHSSKIAEGVRDLALQMAPDYQQLIPAGGLEDGTLGTDTMKILDAVRTANDGDGVALLVDLGSGIMSAETAIELLDGEFPARIADAPLVEGAVVAVIEASTGASLDEVIEAAEGVRGEEKL